MKESIEDRIIAYFDARLTDDESAELLHRVSVSPEIRQVFREHETLREIARTALSTAVVRPELESALFSRIEAIAGHLPDHERAKAAPLFWSRWRAGLATVGVVALLGAAASFGPEIFEGDVEVASESAAVIGGTNRTDGSDGTYVGPDERDEPLVGTDDKRAVEKLMRAERTLATKHQYNERSRVIGEDGAYESDATHGANIGKSSDVSTDVRSGDVSTVAAQSIELTFVGEQRNLPEINRIAVSQDFQPSFEFSLENSTGFAYPASEPGVDPFAEPRLSIGYFIDGQNIVGARLSYGVYQVLPEPTMNRDGAFTRVIRDLEPERHFSPGIYYTHREHSMFGSALNLDATIGAGLIPEGNTISAELGFRIPVSSRMMAGFSFGLTRVHVDAPSLNDVMYSPSISAQNGPVTFEGSEIRNTLNGRIQYGIAYQF